MGTGSTTAFAPPRYRYSSICRLPAAARAQARDTASVALAPRFPLFPLPSVSRIRLSSSCCPHTGIPRSARSSASFTLRTARSTLLP